MFGISPEIISSFGLALVALIVFCETGTIIGFFLPGDTLLISVGVIAATANAPFDEWNKAQRETAAAIGTKMSKVIGPEGGELKSANGKVKLNFPAGAVSEKTEIGIEEIENTAALACGNAFKLTPESATFKKPVLLTLKYTPFDIDGAAPDALNIMTKSENMWFAYKNVEIDTITHTISLPIRWRSAGQNFVKCSLSSGQPKPVR